MAKKRELVLSALIKHAAQFVVVMLCIYVIYAQLSKFSNSETQKTMMFLSVKENAYLLVAAFLLMPLNWFLETKKWQLLLSTIEHISFFKLLKAVLQGVMVGMVTPWRMGEFVGRTFELNRNIAIQSFYFSTLGGMAQAFVTALFGLFFLPWFYPSKWLVIFAAVICAALLLAFLNFHRLPYYFQFFFKKGNSEYTAISTVLQLKVLALSTFRYCIYLLQWILIAYMFSVHDNWLLLAAGASVTLLFQSISPALPFFDLAVRGGISLFVFADMCSNPIAILLSTLALWLINIALPSFFGILFLLKSIKVKADLPKIQVAEKF